MVAKQQAIDKIARAFYSAPAIAGCIGSLAFVALGLYGMTSESILKDRLFFAALAGTGIGLGKRSVSFLRHVWTHSDLPTDAP